MDFSLSKQFELLGSLGDGWPAPWCHPGWFSVIYSSVSMCVRQGDWLTTTPVIQSRGRGRRKVSMGLHMSLPITTHWPELDHMTTMICCKGIWEILSLVRWPCIQLKPEDSVRKKEQNRHG